MQIIWHGWWCLRIIMPNTNWWLWNRIGRADFLEICQEKKSCRVNWVQCLRRRRIFCGLQRLWTELISFLSCLLVKVSSGSFLSFRERWLMTIQKLLIVRPNQGIVYPQFLGFCLGFLCSHPHIHQCHDSQQILTCIADVSERLRIRRCAFLAA